MNTIIFASLAVLAISLISLIGVFALSLKKELIQRGITVLISLAAGALLGDAFIHLLPEALEESGGNVFVPLSVLLGILAFFFIEKFLSWHHSHGDVEFSPEHNHVHPVGPLVVISDALHNFIDGVAIGAAFLINPAAGIATTIAVALHEIPQEVADFGMLIHAGYSKTKALLLNFGTALTAFVGLYLTLLVGESIEAVIPYLGAFAAGNFIYIALADIVPMLKEKTGMKSSLLQLAIILVGIGAMLLLLGLE
jgi:zinc and cadmium transporter